MTNLIWSLVLAVIGIVGIYLAGSKNLWGWLVSFSAQALWLIFAVVTKQYGFILSAVAYGFVYGRNYIRWRRDTKRMRDDYIFESDPQRRNRVRYFRSEYGKIEKVEDGKE